MHTAICCCRRCDHTIHLRHDRWRRYFCPRCGGGIDSYMLRSGGEVTHCSCGQNRRGAGRYCVRCGSAHEVRKGEPVSTDPFTVLLDDDLFGGTSKTHVRDLVSRMMTRFDGFDEVHEETSDGVRRIFAVRERNKSSQPTADIAGLPVARPVDTPPTVAPIDGGPGLTGHLADLLIAAAHRFARLSPGTKVGVLVGGFVMFLLLRRLFS